MKINSYNIRAILMSYYRFDRQYVSCSEVKTDCRELADVVVSTKTNMIEIEIKVSKSDLVRGEAKKVKHKKEDGERVVNKFFVCVPTELVEVAKEWVGEVNPKYGIIEFINSLADKYFCGKGRDYIHIVKNAQLLQPKYKTILKERMFKRLSSALTTEYIGQIK